MLVDALSGGFDRSCFDLVDLAHFFRSHVREHSCQDKPANGVIIHQLADRVSSLLAEMEPFIV